MAAVLKYTDFRVSVLSPAAPWELLIAFCRFLLDSWGFF